MSLADAAHAAHIRRTHEREKDQRDAVRVAAEKMARAARMRAYDAAKEAFGPHAGGFTWHEQWTTPRILACLAGTHPGLPDGLEIHAGPHVAEVTAVLTLHDTETQNNLRPITCLADLGAGIEAWQKEQNR